MKKNILRFIGIVFISLEMIGLFIRFLSSIEIPIEPILWILANLISIIFVFYGFSEDREKEFNRHTERRYKIVPNATNSEADDWILKKLSFRDTIRDIFGLYSGSYLVPIKYIEREIRRKDKRGGKQ